MILRNHTPFPGIVFASEDLERRDYSVVVMKGTFDLIDGTALRPALDQQPLRLADAYYEDPATSSLRYESDLAPFKPRPEIHIVAEAHAPQGVASRGWDVSVRLGAVEKKLRVTGPRQWERISWGGWRLSEPEPCQSLPIRYEYAYGGTWREGETVECCDENPIGRGFVPLALARSLKVIPAPRIESPDDPIGEYGRPYRPEGLGPIGRGWQPRLSLAGTFDESWRRDRWPGLPADFRFAHYNGAHPDLILPGPLVGDEWIELTGLHPAGARRYRLPALKPLLWARFQEGIVLPAPIRLDTIVVDLVQSVATLTWRACLPQEPVIRVAELRLADSPGVCHAG